MSNDSQPNPYLFEGASKNVPETMGRSSSPDALSSSGVTSATDSPLVRGLSAWDTTALVVGSVIGSGVFLKAGAMAKEVSSPMQLIGAWVAAGILSLMGALTYAELGAMLPHAGGEYIYLRQSYGQAMAFFYGWGRFAVASTASIAALAAGIATFSRDFIGYGTPWIEYKFKAFGVYDHTIFFGWEQILAISSILAISFLNCFAVAWGGKFQTFITILKVASLVLIIGGALYFSRTASWTHLAQPEGRPAWSGFSAFGVAMLAALWGYDGWNNMPMAAGEVRDPGKNMPRALIGGMILVMAIYCVINFAYLYVLPYSEVAASAEPGSISVAAKTSRTFLGEGAAKLISIAFVISAIGALNGNILTSARIPYAMARDKIFFRPLGAVSARTHVPVIAVLAQAIWGSILAISGTFDQLTNCLLFVSWIFYGLVCGGVIILRFTHPHEPRPYKVWGYPLTPLIFVVVAAALTVNTLIELPKESIAGLVLLAMGIPIYLYFVLLAPKATTPN